MAFAQHMPRVPYSDPAQAATVPQVHSRHASKQKFIADLSQCLFEFVVQLLPTQEEMAVKEDVRKLLERLIRTIEPDSRLLSFGSTANGFSLRNSDMDLCCLIDSGERLSATDLVTMLGDLLERETKFHVKPLPLARIPIVKLSLDPSPGLPLGIACDIGFENRLALENTRLLMCYAMVDPTRVRTLVLFLKVWSKRRKINSPYKGTLSSYGYVLLVIYFLVHVKNAPVLPNLQQMPPLRPISKEDAQINEYNTWFFDDIDLLRERWRSENTEPVGQLLVDFFRYYSRDFLYNTCVASIRGGPLKKDTKGWQNDLSAGRYDARERNRLCIEDPFETDYNVARCVTKDGLYTIRGEFMRACRILSSRTERTTHVLTLLCEEREDDELVSAPPRGASRLSNLPPQTPFPVGSRSMRPGETSTPSHLPPTKREPTETVDVSKVAERPVPEHMAPKRGKWTSPPPPEAPTVDHTLFEAQLGQSLKLATSSTEAREKTNNSSSSNSEAFTDEDRSDATESDDIMSVRSFSEGTNVVNDPMPVRRPSWHLQDAAIGMPQTHHNRNGNAILSDLLPSTVPHYVTTAFGRNRYNPQRLQRDDLPLHSSLRPNSIRRHIFGTSPNIQGPTPTWSLNPTTGFISTLSPASTPLPASPEKLTPTDYADESSTTVYYQTAGSPRMTSVLYPRSASGSPHLSPHTQHNAFLTRLHQQQQAHSAYNVPQDIFPSNMPPVITSTTANTNPDANAMLFGRSVLQKSLSLGAARLSSAGHDTPTQDRHHLPDHSQPHSATTVTAPTPPPDPTTRFMLPLSQSRSNSPLMRVVEKLNQRSGGSSPRLSSLTPSPHIRSQSPMSRPPSQQQRKLVRTSSARLHPPSGPPPSGPLGAIIAHLTSPQHSTTSTVSNGSSPALSATGTGYESSSSRSPSPRSPRSPPPTAVPTIGRTRRKDSGGVVGGGGGSGGGARREDEEREEEEEEEDEERRMFESFSALEVKTQQQEQVLRNRRQQQQQLLRHHRVTDDPAVLVISPQVPTDSHHHYHHYRPSEEEAVTAAATQ